MPPPPLIAVVSVPLIQLHPMAEQENPLIDIHTTAEVVEQVIFMNAFHQFHLYLVGPIILK